jgi:histone H3/H4
MSAVINVRKLMRENKILKIGKRKKIEFNLSGKAVQEERKYLMALVEKHTQHAMEYARKEGRKTVLEKHIIMVHSRVDSE